MILQDLLTGPSFLTQTLQSTSLFLLIGLSRVADGDHPMNKGIKPMPGQHFIKWCLLG